MYNVDWSVLLNSMLPPKLRQVRMVAWLNSLITPLMSLHSQFLAFVSIIISKISYNSQVICLEMILNESFNNGQPGIYIIDGISFDDMYLYNISEVMPETYLYNISESEPASYLYNNSEINTQYDFIVKVPYFIYNVIDIIQMQALINYYKIASKTYIIEPY